MTTTTQPTRADTTPKNPYQLASRITGWAIPFVFVGALWGAGHDPENAEWSAVAIVAIVVIFTINWVRKTAWNVRNRHSK